MPIGMENPESEKQKILATVNKAWHQWERGANLAEIIDVLDDRSLVLDYSPPDPELLRRAITISFTGRDPGGVGITKPFGPLVPPLRTFVEHVDRKDYRLLGEARSIKLSWENSIFVQSWGRSILNLFDLSEHKARDIWESTAPTMVICQEWPPGLTYRSTEYWDFETTLGCYKPRENSILLFSRGIRICANSVGLSNMDLSLIVWLHEIAHWCVHRYPVIDCESAWDTDSYTKASERVHETLAQWICWRSLRGYPSLENSFEVLKKNQTHLYRLYEEIAGAAPKVVIASIGRLRGSEALSGEYESWRESLFSDESK